MKNNTNTTQLQIVAEVQSVGYELRVVMSVDAPGMFEVWECGQGGDERLDVLDSLRAALSLIADEVEREVGLQS